MFPISGTINPTSSGGGSGGGGGGGSSTGVVSYNLAQGIVKRSFTSNLLGTAADGLLQTAGDGNRLYIVHGTSASFESTLDGTVWYSQLLLGGDGLGSLTQTVAFMVLVNGAAQWPVQFRVPLNDVIGHSDGTYTDDWNDTERWAPLSLVQVQRVPANTFPGAPPNKVVWRTERVSYAYAPPMLLNRPDFMTIV